jgi:hypothetical protein
LISTHAELATGYVACPYREQVNSQIKKIPKNFVLSAEGFQHVFIATNCHWPEIWIGG